MKKFFYLIETEFLGYRFHGWQKQKDVHTVQRAIDRALGHLLKENNFKTLPASRTDTHVSAKQHYFQLYTEKQVEIDIPYELNKCLPADIKILSSKEVEESFQIISSPRYKRYHYYFASISEHYPLAAPFIHQVCEPLNIEIMQEGAKIFIGEHDFTHFTFRLKEGAKTKRVIEDCTIVRNDILTANFFPPESFYLSVQADGFARHQIRLMMGALIQLGQEKISLEDIQNTLKGNQSFQSYMAPAAGLFLQETKFI